MGYRDDLYTVANITGITGPVDSLPSVYFKNPLTNEYGHITQVHGKDWNQGRSAVKTDAGYVIKNECGGGCHCGKPVSHEYNGDGTCFHHSRAVYVPRASLSATDLEVVAQAVWRCPLQKTDPRTKVGRAQQDAMYEDKWNDAHQKGPGGRRNAIDYTAEGLSNRLLKISHPDRL